MSDSELAKKRKSEAVYRAFQETAARRARIAADFRARLTAELGERRPAASTGAMVDMAVSAFTQASELSAYFLAGRATPQQVSQLSISRGQLQRALRALGLTRDAADESRDAEAFKQELEALAHD